MSLTEEERRILVQLELEKARVILNQVGGLTWTEKEADKSILTAFLSGY